MTAWLRWQCACLADDMRRMWHRVWLGKPGRHGQVREGGWQDYNTGQMAAIETDLAARPWLVLEPAPALLSAPNPAPGPELFHDDLERVADDSFIAGVADALLRATNPRLYAPDPDYWAYAWAAFDEYEPFGDTQVWRDEAEANELRAVCGLGPRGARLDLSWVA